MNKSYRTVWNATTGTWVAAEETARSKSKGSSRVARKAFVAVTLGGVAIGGAAAADFGDALESTDGSGDEESVIQVPITGTKSQMNARSIGTDAIGTMAAIDDTYIKIRSGLYGPARPAVAAPEGDGAIAIGASATATGISSLALGGGAIANTTNAMAIGTIARATGTETLAAGVGSAATATYSSALGRGATATAEGSTALGSFAVADRANTVSVGSAAGRRAIVNMAAGTQATDAVNVSQLTPIVTALGGGATINATTGAVTGPTYNLTNGGRQTTVGGALTALDNALTTSNRFVKVNGTTDATANGAGSIAIGSGATTTPLIGGSSTGQTAIGNGATANGLSSTALGSSAEANGTGALAAGRLSNATGNSSTALGNQASAQAGGATALGNLASVAAGATNSVAIGNNASVAENVTNSMALGTNAIANRNDTISVGSATQQRQITNLAAGTQDTDAVNLAQLNAAIANVGSDSPYFQANGAGDGSDAASAVGAGSVAVGSNASTVADGGVAIGNNAKSEMQNGVAIGNAAVASEDGVAIGRDAHAQSANSLAFGAQSSAAANGTSLGFNAKAADNAMALGANTVAAGSNSVALGNGSVASVANTVSVGSAGNERKIVNVADGDLSATSTDAVIGSQLFATNTRVGSLEDSLKGGGVIDPTTGESLAVVYDGTAKDKVTLAGGATGTTIANVKAGVADMDAVNVSQLKDSGLIGNDGKAIAAVTYDRNPDGTPNYGSVTLGDGNGPVKVTNVADATGDSDALNLGQLKQAGLVGEDGQGNLTSLAVAYDDASKGTVTLGGGAAGTTITNVKAGELSATSTDAVNGAQLFATNQDIGDLRDSLKGGGVIDPVTGESLAVVYDSAAKNQVTLGGANATTPVQLKNVAAGTDGTDAVNVAQLKEAGLVAPVDPTNPGAGLTSLAVTYGDASKSTVALGGANGTTLSNVAAGAVSATSTDAINGSQLHGVSQSVADSLGGGSTVGADGTVTNPTYSLADPADASQKQDYHNVGDALANLDGRVVDNTTNITVIKNQLADSGLVDPVTGQSIAAVTYDRNTDGTPNYGSVTLGNGNDPVKVSNVADGVDRHDAVNLGQLQDAGLVAPVDPTNPGTMTSLAVTYGKNTDGTANFDQVVLAGKGGTTISNVKAGELSATSTDAVNGSQLYATNQDIGNLRDSLKEGGVIDPTTGESLAVVYDDATKTGVTLGNSGTPVGIHNVAEGDLSATSTDAVNGSQLYATNTRVGSLEDSLKEGGLIDPTTGESLAVVYDSAAKDHVTLGGANASNPVVLSNVAAGVAGTDAVNVDQLTGALKDIEAGANPLGVQYDSIAKNSVTLGGVGTSAPPVILTNVADGVTKYDAVNFGQLSELNDKIDDMDGRVGALEQNPGNGGGTGDSPYFSGTDVTPGSSTAANAGTGTGNTAAGSGASVGGGANNATVIGSNASATKDNGAAIGSGAKSTGEGATAIGSNASASGSQSVAIGSGSVANEANTVSFGNGTDDGNRRIVNIADGINANDAASKGQLDRAVGGLQGQINDVSKNAYSGIAAATALTMIPGVDPGKTLSFGVGGATYKGYQAVAFGGEARITQNLKMKAGVGLSSGGNTVGVGASYQW
ncbi:YadA-like family protein [Burkholderia orbicola]|uniref:YadA-like family protein n=1 Tax=Burkholderia orbicola TaxID=2978683 RepID=UPI003AF9190A